MADEVLIAIKAVDDASNTLKGVSASLDSVDKQVKKTADGFSKLDQAADRMKDIGAKMTLGVTLPIAGIAVAATKAASDLSETTNKIDTLFGKSSQAIKDWSTTASTALGQSRKQALDAAADFAVFGKSAGLAGNGLVQFSKQNVQLASDMASFFNTSPEEAITAIGAAFRGESEPIRRYGVLINEASLKDQALRMGLIKTTTEALQPQQRVLAAQALIMQQTTAAQGDFAKTADGLANSTRIVNAQLQDTLAALGEKLLPIALKGATAIKDLLTAFQGLSPEMQNAIVAFAGIAAAAGPVLSIGGKLVDSFGLIKTAVAGLGTSAAPLALIVAGLTAIVAYLEKVSVAAKATTDDLLKMANSGDVLQQAAATTEILAHGQDRLKAALDGTHEKIKAGAKNYADYRSAIEATARAAGYEINANGDLIQAYYGMSGRQEKIIQGNYALNESQMLVAQGAENQAKVYGVLDSAMQRTQATTAQSTAGLAEYYKATRDASIEGLARANEQAAQSIEVLKTAMAGAVSKEMESFKAKQDELQAKAAELQSVISTSYGKAREDAVKSLGEINAQLGANAAAHEEATKRILFDIAAQQLATVQDPQIRAKAMNELALQWGLVDQATYDATTKIIGYTDQLAKDNNIEAYKNKLGGMSDEMLGFPAVVADSVEKTKAETGKLAESPVKVPIEIDKEAAAKSLQETQEELRDKALGREIVIPVTTQVSTVEVGQGAGERDKQMAAREADAQKRAQTLGEAVTGAAKKATDAVTDMSDRATGRVTTLMTNTETKSRSLANTITGNFNSTTNSIVSAFNVAEGQASSALGSIIDWVGELPTYKEFVYHIKVTGDDIPGRIGGAQYGADFIVPSNPRGGTGDYFPVLAAPGERVTVQTKAQQAANQTARGGDNIAYNYTTNVYNPLAAAYIMEQQRRDRLARSNARMGVA